MWGFEDFAALLLEAARGALPYIGAGVAAGVVVFAVVFGIRKGLLALYEAQHDEPYGENRSGGDWSDEDEAEWLHDQQQAAYLENMDDGMDERDAWNKSQMDTYLD